MSGKTHDNVYAVILAGGEGTRFAPLSTPERPKQFLRLFGEGSFLQETYRRLNGLIAAQRVYVSTNARYVGLVRGQLPEVLPEQIVGEPRKKNTAPAIAYMARLIFERDPSAVMVVLPSDHYIEQVDRFHELLRLALRIAAGKEVLLTLGVTPQWAAVQYGYIERATTSIFDHPDVYPVRRFVEKPDAVRADAFLRSGLHYWNAGIFIWQAAQFLKALQSCLPTMAVTLQQFVPTQQFREGFFAQAEAISVDYGVMERSSQVAMISCDVGWSDVGSWGALRRLSQSGEIVLSPEAQRALKENA